MEEDTETHFFGLKIIRTVDKKTNRMNVHLETQSEKITLPEAVLYIEGWVNKIKSELQKPITDTLFIGTRCASCNKLLRNEDVKVRNGKPYCDVCF